MINITSPGAIISSFKSFIGGMVTDILPTGLKPYMMPNCLNVLPDISIGTLETRAGSVIMGQLPSKLPCKFLFTFNKTDGGSIVLVSDGATLWSTADFRTFSSKKTGLTATAVMSACVVRNKVWLTNGVDAVMTYDSADTLVVLDGTGTLPDVPKGYYIMFCQERVWIAKTSALSSVIYFSALNDASGNPIAPDNDVAWPAVNALNCDQDDGDSIFGIIAYLGTPFIFKSKSVGAVTGSDEYSYGYQRVMSNIGTRFHECLVERDGVLEFVGPDGFYESQGSAATTVRVSDLIETEFKKLSQPKVNDHQTKWNLGAEWATGAYSNTEVGDDLMYSTDSVVLTDTLTLIDAFASAAAWVVNYGTGVISAGKYVLSNSTLKYAEAYIASLVAVGTWQCELTASYIAGHTTRCGLKFLSGITGYIGGDFYGAGIYVKDAGTYLYLEKSINGTRTELSSILVGTNLQSSGTVKITRSLLGVIKVYWDGVLKLTVTDTDKTITGYLMIYVDYDSVSSAWSASFDNLYITRYPVAGTNTWISAITDIGVAANITRWGTFEAISNLNGQTITYQIKGATTSGGVAGATYHTITPGSIVAETLTTPFIQVKASLSSADAQLTPELTDIKVNYVTGGVSTQKMCSITFQNRNLLSASQEGYAYNNIVWVKPRRIYKPEDMQAVFVPFDWKILSFCVLNDNLYAGISYNDSTATDEGAIVRLFTGTRDEVYSGAGTAIVTAKAINSFFETKDETFELSMNKKKLMEIAVDYTPQEGTLLLERSTDNGTFVTVATLDNTGLKRTSKIQAVRGVLGKTHRLRITKNTIDQYMKIHGLEMIATPIRIRE